MEKDFDIAVIGAGPSGLTAAIEAKTSNKDARVVILEKMDEAAKKLSATGNGRGNLSNSRCDMLPSVIEFFSQCGIVTRADEAGRIYPYSEEAKAVSRVLIKRATNLGVKIITKASVSNVEVDSKGYFHIFISEKKDSYIAKKVLIATGGKSFANYGSSGDGFIMARKLGHEVTPLIPALTAIEVSQNIKDLKGIRAKVNVSLLEAGNVIAQEEGEIQFRDDAVSGICIMNLSSLLPAGKVSESGKRYEDCLLMVNFVPDFSTTELMNFIKAQSRTEGVKNAEMMETLVKKPIAQRILKDAGIELLSETTRLTPKEMVAIANALRGFTLSPCGKKGWKEAQVTKGGVSLDEINLETMESKLIEGLYFAGEVIDYDGPCGGYNLHNAWITGMKSGKDMASRV